MVNLHREIVELTMSIVSKALYNSDVRGDAKSIGEVASAVMGMFRLMVSPFATTVLKLPIAPSRRFREAKQQLDGWFTA